MNPDTKKEFYSFCPNPLKLVQVKREFFAKINAKRKDQRLFQVKEFIIYHVT